jgi:flagellin
MYDNRHDNMEVIVMRINHNISSMITQTALGSASTDMSKNLEKLSTGLRINRASDDAAGLSVSEELRTQVRGNTQAKANAEDGIALLQIAEGAANEISSILQRQRELAVQASNDTLTSTERAYLDQEFTHLTEEITRISRASQYNGMTLIDGVSSGDINTSTFGTSGGPCVLHVGANYDSNVDELEIQITGISAMALGLTGTGVSTVNISATNIGVSTQAMALEALEKVDNAIESVNSMRSDLGAYINRLEHTIDNLDNQSYNQQDAESRIRDVDFATESSDFTKNQILTQSSTAMLAQANLKPQSVLQLLI